MGTGLQDVQQTQTAWGSGDAGGSHPSTAVRVSRNCRLCDAWAEGRKSQGSRWFSRERGPHMGFLPFYLPVCSRFPQVSCYYKEGQLVTWEEGKGVLTWGIGESCSTGAWGPSLALGPAGPGCTWSLPRSLEAGSPLRMSSGSSRPGAAQGGRSFGWLGSGDTGALL